MEVAPWYPMDYDNIDAVDFFLTAVRNHRASTMQEMVNLYETERHQRRMEQGQQQILNQQRIGNMLQLGNLFIQGQVLSQAQQINANTASGSGPPSNPGCMDHGGFRHDPCSGQPMWSSPYGGCHHFRAPYTASAKDRNNG